MSVFSPAASAELTVTSQETTKTLEVHNFSISLADTEYSFTFPANTNRFLLRLRQAGILRIAHSSGGTSTNYLTVSPGSVYTHTGVDYGGKTIYFRSSVGSTVLEIEVGKST